VRTVGIVGRITGQAQKKCYNLWLSAKCLTSIFIISSIGVDVDFFHQTIQLFHVISRIFSFYVQRKILIEYMFCNTELFED